MENAPQFNFPRLNEPAPAFCARTTHGERKLEDYRGKWLILFSHPADFTPVCTTEFMAFAKAAPTFSSMGCELLGLSIDSLFSHLAWTRNITVEQLRAGYSKNAIPIGRSGRLSEVADYVCYLLSERASYITGVTTNIAGGKTRG